MVMKQCEICGKQIRATSDDQLVYLMNRHMFWKHDMEIDNVEEQDEKK